MILEEVFTHYQFGYHFLTSTAGDAHLQAPLLCFQSCQQNKTVLMQDEQESVTEMVEATLYTNDNTK